RIAQVPAAARERSRLMIVDRSAAEVSHTVFSDGVSWLPERALLVVNDSRVIRARLRGNKRESGGAVEALILAVGQGGVAPAMVRVAKPLRAGQIVDFAGDVSARVVAA